MVHSRDDEEVGVAHEVKSPENQPQFSQTMIGQVKLSPTKLSDQPEMLLKVAMEFLKKKLFTEFSTDCLMSSD